MKKMIISIFLLALALCAFAQFEIQNAIATPGSGKVTITYDLIHPENIACSISIEVSADAGASYTIVPTAVSGDIGENIIPGSGKTIIWYPAADNMEEGENYKIRINADDHLPPLPLSTFILVEEGTFHNGTSNISLSSFYLGRYEVTQESYEAVMAWNPSWYFGNPDRPVERFPWFKAIEYCNRRSIQEGLSPCYSYSTYGTNPAGWPVGWNTTNANHVNISCNWNVDGYRLPTEMEWMYAAKGGNQSEAYSYSGSNTIDDVAWYWNNSDIGDGQGNRTHDIGEKDQNELGFFDMNGNVWEWCWDIHASYLPDDQTNPKGASSGSYRILRGAAYNSDISSCPLSYRSYASPTSTDRSTGFRIAKSIPVIQTITTPVFNPPAGTYFAAMNVSITCETDGVSIHYTTDNSEPDESSAVYDSPILVEINTTLKAKAYKVGWDASAIAVAEYVIQELAADFVLVEGGTFNNGTSNVTLSSFYMDKYEIIQSSYQAVMGENPSGFGGNPNRPVERVSWFNAIEYCNRRSIGEGLTPCYTYSTYGTNPDNWPEAWDTINDNHYNITWNWSANGYRLPTEMEWLFAFKGGNDSQDYIYSGSDDVNDVAWYEVNSDDRTHDVGGLASNELGIFDMSGNVSVKCWDIYSDSLPSGDQINPTGPDSGIHCVSRGGHWDSAYGECWYGSRGSAGFIAIINRSGIRCVRSSM